MAVVFTYHFMLRACVWGREKGAFGSDGRYDQCGAHFCKEGIAFVSLVSRIELLFANDVHLFYNCLVQWVEIIIHLEQVRREA